MGWFDDDEEFVIEVIAAPMFEEEATPLKTALNTAIMSNQDQYDFLALAHFNSVELPMRRLMNYAKDPVKYPQGLPEITATGLSYNADALDDVINTIVGEPATVESIKIREPDLWYWAQLYLMDQYPLYNSTGHPSLYLKADGHKRSYYYTFYSVFKTGKYSNDRFVSDGKYRITLRAFIGCLPNYSDPDGGRVPRYSTIIFDVPLPVVKSYWHVSYTIDSEPKEDPDIPGIPIPYNTYYWIYDPSTNVYPELTLDLPPTIDETPFMPIIPIMIDGKFLADRAPSDIDYKSNQGLLRKIHMNYDSITDAVKGVGADKDDKPDLDKVDDIFYTFSIDIYTKCEASIQYLYHFFTKLHTTAMYDETLYATERSRFLHSGKEPRLNYWTMRENDFDLDIQFSYITLTTGNLGSRPDYKNWSKEVVIKPNVKYTYKMQRTHAVEPVCADDTNYDPDSPEWLMIDNIAVKYMTESEVRIKHWTSEGTYDELVVVGLVHRSTVRALGDKDSKYLRLDEEWVSGKNSHTDKKGQSGFFIPLNEEALKPLGLIDTEIALWDSMRLVIYAADIIVTKWYEKGFFKILIQVVVIVVGVILSLYFGPGAFTVMNVVLQSLIAIAISFAVSFATDFLMKMLGPKWVAIILVIVTIIKIIQFDFTALMQGMMSAQTLMTLKNAIQEIVTAYTQVKGLLLQDEMIDYAEDLEKKELELSEASDLLGPAPAGYDHMAMLELQDKRKEVIPIFGETPSDFYERTIHTHNMADVSLEQHHVYHDQQLMLPQPNYNI